jgi:hypothetical protein
VGRKKGGTACELLAKAIWQEIGETCRNDESIRRIVDGSVHFVDSFGAWAVGFAADGAMGEGLWRGYSRPWRGRQMVAFCSEGIPGQA